MGIIMENMVRAGRFRGEGMGNTVARKGHLTMCAPMRWACFTPALSQALVVPSTMLADITV
jgi:hypothetical protein